MNEVSLYKSIQESDLLVWLTVEGFECPPVGYSNTQWSCKELFVVVRLE